RECQKNPFPLLSHRFCTDEHFEQLCTGESFNHAGKGDGRHFRHYISPACDGNDRPRVEHRSAEYGTSCLKTLCSDTVRIHHAFCPCLYNDIEKAAPK